MLLICLHICPQYRRNWDKLGETPAFLSYFRLSLSSLWRYFRNTGIFFRITFMFSPKPQLAISFTIISINKPIETNFGDFNKHFDRRETKNWKKFLYGKDGKQIFQIDLSISCLSLGQEAIRSEFIILVWKTFFT